MLGKQLLRDNVCVKVFELEIPLMRARASGLAGVATLSWIYLIYMAGRMRNMDVGMEMVIMPAMRHWTAWDLVLVFLMWAVMMVAMMVPAASPVILLFLLTSYFRSGA